MPRTRRRSLLGAFFFLPLLLARPARSQERPFGLPTDGGPYVPSPWIIVERMLQLADVNNDDVVYDLGSGDGRLVIEAARRHGARGLGIEFEERLVQLSRAAAGREGVADRVAFEQGDVMEADLRGATVITMYLLPRLLVKLGPKMRAELRPGTRVVTHDYPIPGWTPQQLVAFDVQEKTEISGSPKTDLYLYRVPDAWAVSG